MALVEIEDSELASYKQVTGVMQRMLNNPKTRRQILEAQKTLDPNLVIPELDAATPVLEEVKSLRELLAADKAEREVEKAEREKTERMAKLQSQWDSGRARLRQQGYQEEGIQAVEKFMEDKGIADHEVGAAAFERMHPPVEPVIPTGSNRFDWLGAKDDSSEHMKALFNDPDNDQALNSIINDTLKQVRGR